MEGDCHFSFSFAFLSNFNPLPPRGGRPDIDVSLSVTTIFQSTPSAWRETSRSCLSSKFQRYFNPLPPRGGRRGVTHLNYLFNDISIHSLRVEGDYKRFNYKNKHTISIHSLRVEGDRQTVIIIINNDLFQSTPSAWRETMNADTYKSCGKISIHSLRVEGDRLPEIEEQGQRYFNPLPPRGGRRAWR